MPVQVIVTGFGSFHGVKLNPTQSLVKWLDMQYCHRSASTSSKGHGSVPEHTSISGTSLAGGEQYHPNSCEVPQASVHPTPDAITHSNHHIQDCHIRSCTVLPVSAEAVNNYIANREADLCNSDSQLHQALCHGETVLLLHLGVDVKRSWINLEQWAVNNATFRCPDEASWQPTEQPIDDSADLNSHIATDLHLDTLEKALQQLGHNVRVSTDAGRFVCNWTYYKSLALVQCTSQTLGHRCHSLFVHLPCFDAVGETEQRQFVIDLLHAVCQQLTAITTTHTEAAQEAPCLSEAAVQTPSAILDPCSTDGAAPAAVIHSVSVDSAVPGQGLTAHRAALGLLTS